jgi:Protein of unknown function (DUF4199)
MEQTITSTTTKGVVIALILMILHLATYFANLDPQGFAPWLGYAVFIIGVIWSVYSYGKQVEYNSTFGNYFAHGFKVAALVTALMIIFLVIFVLLFPDFKDKAMDKARAGMREKNNLSEEQMTQAVDMMKKFFMVFFIGGTLLFFLICGAISALIGAAVTKKQPNNFAGDVNQIGK